MSLVLKVRIEKIDQVGCIWFGGRGAWFFFYSQKKKKKKIVQIKTMRFASAMSVSEAVEQVFTCLIVEHLNFFSFFFVALASRKNWRRWSRSRSVSTRRRSTSIALVASRKNVAILRFESQCKERSEKTKKVVWRLLVLQDYLIYKKRHRPLKVLLIDTTTKMVCRLLSFKKKKNWPKTVLCVGVDWWQCPCGWHCDCHWSQDELEKSGRIFVDVQQQ